MRRLTWILAFFAISMFAVDAAAQADIEADSALQRANELAAEGKLKESVPRYREALTLDPGAHPLAYYNLAEVYRALGRCQPAVLMFQLFASVRQTDEAKSDAAAGVKKCRGTGYPTLAVKVKPEGARVLIDGFLASTGGDLAPIGLPPGEYDVEVTATDHEPVTKRVKLGQEDVSIQFELEELTFFGKVRVEVDVDGARVRVFSGASDETEVTHDLKTPMKKGVELKEGRHFVEVTADGYDRWIRNVSVLREDETVVKVKMTPSKPKETQ